MANYTSVRAVENRDYAMPRPLNPEQPDAAPVLDTALFRKVMGLFATGVTVVTSRQGDYLHGITVNAFMSVSLTPPLVVVGIDKRARAHPIIAASGIYAVNFLAAGQQEISDTFAGRRADPRPFDSIAHSFGLTGAPLLDGTLGAIECRVYAAHDSGDHTLYVGEVVALRRNDAADTAAPVLYYKSKYASL